MKVLKCNKCNRTQKEGKYCLDCGNSLVEIITTKIKFKPMNTAKSAETIKKHIREWLSRIGVQQADIQISSSETRAEVSYIINKEKYKLTSFMQDDLKNNLASIEQLIHYRVIGIERGIETTQQAFAGYVALPSGNEQDPYKILGFSQKVSLEEAKLKFKKLANIYHPDKGGDSEMFNRIVKAVKEIEENENK